MNGGHDLGGKQGFGAIAAEADEPCFHAEWERRVFALTLAAGMLGQWNIDESRHARENQPPVNYLGQSYYHNWLVGLEKLLAQKQLLDCSPQQAKQYPVPDPQAARTLLARGGPSLMPQQQAPRFASGDQVRVKRSHSSGHTRIPGYVQGARGTIREHYGSHVYPDANARGERRGEALYSVAFLGTELWGEGAEVAEVLVDLWEPYLEAAEETR